MGCSMRCLGCRDFFMRCSLYSSFASIYHCHPFHSSFDEVELKQRGAHPTEIEGFAWPASGSEHNSAQATWVQNDYCTKLE
ncbi:Protein of unknown function [Pyronema omphalodes CBS 100304]|uniref:Uncharacterized protein n=1 Tax=Pyronema omphalodes (strain CBS 100304) TaxID=1076935 RepID=U4LPG6_PYROM|nr:Protein of unknown function [Pyronema omphalodes CBS 100304]